MKLDIFPRFVESKFYSELVESKFEERKARTHQFKPERPPIEFNAPLNERHLESYVNT